MILLFILLALSLALSIYFSSSVIITDKTATVGCIVTSILIVILIFLTGLL